MTATFNGFGPKAIPFLKALDFHQSRDWFLENKDLFEQQLKNPLGDLVEVLTERLQAAGLGLRGERKKSLFRINRDVRFAKDKRPYNTHLSAMLTPDGTKSENGVLFVYVGLDRCFAGVAWYQPSPALLQAMREAIVKRSGVFRAMVAELGSNGLALDETERLKRAPRGFETVSERDLAAAVRSRHFIVRHEIEPAKIERPELADELVDFALRAKPLLDWGRAIEARVPPEERKNAAKR